MKVLTLPAGYERRIPLDLAQPCWLGRGSAQPHGYAVLMIDSERKYIHRVAYQLHVGPIPRGWELDHACHSAAVLAGNCTDAICAHRACWNPAHLEAVSSFENSLRGNHPLFAVQRRQRCDRGHDLADPANVYVRPDGRRRCAPCRTVGQRERRLRSKL